VLHLRRRRASQRKLPPSQRKHPPSPGQLPPNRCFEHMLARASGSVLIAVALALSACGGGVGVGGPSTTADKALDVPPQAELMADGPLGEAVLGKANAAVTVIEYVSLTCPHCANFQK